jgi:CBS domain-containing protein
VRDVLAGDIMSSPVIAVSAGATLEEAAKTMVSRKVGSVLVSDGEQYVGIITKMDVVRLVAKGGDPKLTKAKQVMSSPLKKVNVSATAMDVAKTMRREGIHRVVVADNDGVVGIISDKDIVSVAPEIVDITCEFRKIEGK